MPDDDSEKTNNAEQGSDTGKQSGTVDQKNDVPAGKLPASWLYRVYRGATSVPLLLLVILLLLEIWLRQGNPIDALGIRSVDLWGADTRLRLCQRILPQVILIGSSLVLALDQNQESGDYLTGHNGSYLRGLLDKATGADISCIDLATGAQMASEAYFMSQAASSWRHPPGVIIYGVAMRDFSNEEQAGEWRTESFNSIAPFSPLSAAADIYTAPGLREFLLCHYSYLYRNRGDFKNLFAVRIKDLMEKLPLNQPFYRQGPDGDWRPAKDGNLKECLIPRKREAFLEKMRIEQPQRLKDFFKNVQVTASRGENKQAMDLSRHYFKRLQQLCKRKNILLVVVNMPLSPDTSLVLPAKSIQTFRDYLHQGELDGGYALIDLWADPNFIDSDYKDGVHFNFVGVRKFSDILVQQLQTRFPAVLDRMAAQARGK